MQWRDIISFLDNHPKFEAGLEAVFTIIVSFAPFFLGAFVSISKNEQFEFSIYKGMLLSYFSSGEITLYIFTVCGSIIWMTVFSAKNMGVAIKFFITVVIFISIFLFSALLLGSNPGFDEKLPNWVLAISFYVYLFALAIWILISISEKSIKIGDRSNVSNADRIINEARGRQNE